MQNTCVRHVYVVSTPLVRALPPLRYQAWGCGLRVFVTTVRMREEPWPRPQLCGTEENWTQRWSGLHGGAFRP